MNHMGLSVDDNTANTKQVEIYAIDSITSKTIKKLQ